MTAVVRRLATTADRSVARVAFLTHVLAAFASLLWLSRGSPVGPSLEERQAYVDVHWVEWRLAWLSWTLASLSLFWLLSRLDRRAMATAGIGLLFDLPAQWVLATPVWPLESTAYFSTGVIANSFYTLALAQAAWRADLAPWLRWLALPAILAGTAVTVATALRHPAAMFWSTGALTVLMIAWTFALGVRPWRAS